MAEGLSADERNAVVARMRELDALRYPALDGPQPSGRELDELSEEYYVRVGEYFDGLPRMVMSGCPYCGNALVRVFDPHGVNGLFWLTEKVFAYDEPKPCEHFRVLLGAWKKGEQDFGDVEQECQPGPEVPFVIPALLAHPGMIAVAGKVDMTSGDTAYPIAYFSNEPVEPGALHQPWLRTALWFTNDDGEQSWTFMTDPWEFELAPLVESRQLRWVFLEDDEDPPLVHQDGSERACPFVGLPGERLPQVLNGTEHLYMDLPTGDPANPFEEDGSYEEVE